MVDSQRATAALTPHPAPWSYSSSVCKCVCVCVCAIADTIPVKTPTSPSSATPSAPSSPASPAPEAAAERRALALHARHLVVVVAPLPLVLLTVPI